MKTGPLSTVTGAGFGVLLGSLLVVPLIGLALSTSAQDLLDAVTHRSFGPALALSLSTTVTSLILIIMTGLPFAWWLATSTSRAAAIAEVIVEIPIVIPPAVIGVALLQTFGRQGVLGPALERLGIVLPFTESAVIIAQIVVSSPFFVQAAAAAFRKVDADMLTVARTLGASAPVAFARVALPIALPGLLAGASVAWARALGEFGATLVFAGNMTGRTQTLPLAIFAALESDLRLAVAISIVLATVGAGLLLGLRLGPALLKRARGGAT